MSEYFQFKTGSTLPVVVYTKDPCPYCDLVLRLLKNFKYEFEERDLTDQPNEMLRLKEETGWRTFPIVIIRDQVIGGYTDIKALHDQGLLQGLVNPA